jgi:hypothetical protein
MDSEELEQHWEQPSARRRPPRELNRRVVPELTVLIERMLAEQPEARGAARDAAHAAESAAARPEPRLDVPLWDAPQREELESVSFRMIPPSSSEPPKAEAVPKPIPASTEPRDSTRTAQLRLMLAMMLLAVVSSWWLGRAPRGHMPGMAQGAELEAEEGQDSGNTGLGDGGVTARAEPPEQPTPGKAIAKQVPTQPLPNQLRAPCGRGEIEIRGGCWVLWTALTPPCGEKAYEWNGACYLPLLKGEQRVPTTEDPQ